MKKRVLQSIITVFTLLGVIFFAKWSDEYHTLRMEKFGVEQSPVILPTNTIAEELRAREIVNYMDVSAGYKSEYEGWMYPAELLEELQEYVATDSMDLILADYMNKSVKISVEDFIRKCPDYAQVLRDWFANENYWFSACESFDVVGTRFSVYEMQLEGQTVWVLKYIGHSCVDYPILLAQKDGEAYVIGFEYWDNGNFTIIPYEQNGEIAYYVIEILRDGSGSSYAISLAHPYVYHAWDEEEDGKIHIIFASNLYVYNSLETVVPRYTYINSKELLAHQVKAYVDENLWALAYLNWNRTWIWGDEEVPTFMTEVEQMHVLEATGEQSYYALEYALADYNNDGEKELFYRTSGKSNIYLEQQADGSFKKYFYRLSVDGRGLDVEKLWFVEFGDKVITFEIAERFGSDDGKFLVAYIYENGKQTPLLVYRICHEQTITVTEEYISASQVAFDDKVSLLESEVPSEAEQRRTADRRSMISLKQIERVVSLWQDPVPFSESLYNVVRETFHELAQGNYSEYYRWDTLEAYMVDTVKDTKEFGKYVDELTDWNGDSYEVPFDNGYIWGYKWFEEGSTKNYLVCDYGNGYGGSVGLGWYKVSDGEVCYVETISESHEDGEFRLISYEGKLYCISTLWKKPGHYSLCGMQVICLGEKGDWETHVYKLEADYECIPVYQYGETKDLFQEYVTDHYTEMITAMQNEQWYGANSGVEGLAKDEIRMFKNILGPRFGENGALWMLADIDNDSIQEYITCDTTYFGNFDFRIYRNANGEFRELDVFGETIYDELVKKGAQFWVEERDGVNYVFVLEKSGVVVTDYVLHIRTVQDGELTEKAAYLFRANPREVVE